MRYVSTRGSAPPVGFVAATLAGIAPDGGLYVPETIPQFSPKDIEAMRGLSYTEIACRVMEPYVAGDSLSLNTFREHMRNAYESDVWESRQVAPVVKLEHGLHVLELFRGPTLAFKDLALQALGQVLPYLLAERGERLVILGATSGDTGPAAIHALAGKPGIDVFMLFPHGGTSPFQRRQMTTVEDENIHCVAIKGNFDACQAIVKKYQYGAINSINWFRIMAQIPYYFWAYLKATKSVDERVSFAVPTGNFGNIYAGYLAMRMGLPIGRLILASNENDMLERFVREGTYQPKAVLATSSPSQDISRASNAERLVYHMLNQPEHVRDLYEQKLSNCGFFWIPRRFFTEARISAGSAGTRIRHDTIQAVYKEHGYVLDPHSANGFAVGEPLRDSEPLIVHATASPVKFQETMRDVLGFDPEIPDRFSDIGDRPERFATLPADAEHVRNYIETLMNRKTT